MTTFLGTLSFPGQDHSTHQKLQVFVTGFKFLFSLIIKKIMNSLNFHFLFLVLMIIMTWFL